MSPSASHAPSKTMQKRFADFEGMSKATVVRTMPLAPGRTPALDRAFETLIESQKALMPQTMHWPENVEFKEKNGYTEATGKGPKGNWMLGAYKSVLPNFHKAIDVHWIIYLLQTGDVFALGSPKATVPNTSFARIIGEVPIVFLGTLDIHPLCSEDDIKKIEQYVMAENNLVPVWGLKTEKTLTICDGP